MAKKYPACLAREDFCEYSGLSRKSFYELANRPDVPSIRIRNKIYISRAGFDKWLE